MLTRLSANVCPPYVVEIQPLLTSQLIISFGTDSYDRRSGRSLEELCERSLYDIAPMRGLQLVKIQMLTFMAKRRVTCTCGTAASFDPQKLAFDE
jgi:hypothetical protein